MTQKIYFNCDPALKLLYLLLTQDKKLNNKYCFFLLLSFLFLIFEILQLKNKNNNINIFQKIKIVIKLKIIVRKKKKLISSNIL